MQSQLQNTQIQPKVQSTYNSILSKVEELYLNFVPDTIRLRRNINQRKQPDTVIIATMIWGMMMGFPTKKVRIKRFVLFCIPIIFQVILATID
ncbi:hypothetical protein P7H55_08700 [Vagococcus lutrae]|nr:hypothetical protein [Vagococcus lutrae]MDT2817917.1 hypothetical protein [Vagococcus lutrae]